VTAAHSTFVPQWNALYFTLLYCTVIWLFNVLRANRQSSVHVSSFWDAVHRQWVTPQEAASHLTLHRHVSVCHSIKCSLCAVCLQLQSALLISSNTLATGLLYISIHVSGQCMDRRLLRYTWCSKDISHVLFDIAM